MAYEIYDWVIKMYKHHRGRTMGRVLNYLFELIPRYYDTVFVSFDRFDNLVTIYTDAKCKNIVFRMRWVGDTDQLEMVPFWHGKYFCGKLDNLNDLMKIVEQKMQKATEFDKLFYGAGGLSYNPEIFNEDGIWSYERDKAYEENKEKVNRQKFLDSIKSAILY